MNLFNRIVVTLLWLVLLAVVLVGAATPQQTVGWVQVELQRFAGWLAERKTVNPTSFIVGQAAVGISALLVLGTLLFFEIMSGRRRGVRIHTSEGGMAEVDTASIGRRLQWHLLQVAEVTAVVPNVKSRRGAVEVRIEIETAPDVDIPMKTDEVVDVTRAVVVQDMGLRLSKLDVRLRCAPFEPEWTG